MSYTLSPNMLLRIPAVGADEGPDYAININYDLLSVLDTHDHTPGKGTQITPASFDINGNLSFNNHFATNVAGLSLVAQLSTPLTGTVYQSGVDLYFVDGVGNNIRMTQSGGVAGTPGSITNLLPPASVTYVSGSQTFVFESNVGIAANIDGGAHLFRNLSPNSTFAVVLQASAALAASYDLILPALPPVQSFMTLNSSGEMAAPWTVDDTTIKVTANELVVQPAALDYNNISSGLTATTFQTAIDELAAMSGGTIESEIFLTSNTWVVPDNVTNILYLLIGGGGGGGGNPSGASRGGGGGGGAQILEGRLETTPGETATITIAAGGAGSIGSGSIGGNSSLAVAARTVTAYGGGGGSTGTADGETSGSGWPGGTSTATGGGGGGGGGGMGGGYSVGGIGVNAGGTGGSPGWSAGGGGGQNGGAGSTGGNGGKSQFAAGGTGAPASANRSSGGGGGAGLEAGGNGSNGLVPSTVGGIGGGGGGGGDATNTQHSGENGGPGYCVIMWVPVGVP